MPAFTASGQRSSEFYGMRGGVDVGIMIDAGSNSLTLEQNIGGVWHTIGAAKTATGRTHLTSGVDYAAPALMRLVCGTFATGPVTYAIEGDVIGPGLSMSGVGVGGRELETGEARQLENGQYRLLEDA